MKQNRSTWQIFLVVLFSVLSALIIGTALSSIDYGGNTSISTYIGMFLAQFFIVVPVILLLKRNNLNIAKSLRINRVSKKILLYSFILSVGAVVISDEINILFEMIIPLPESFSQLENILRPDELISFVLLSLTIVIIAPIGEELLFRGFLQHYLENTWKDVTRAILVSSLFFAFIHFNPYWIIQIYLLGILLGYLAWKTQSVLPSIVFHICINGTSLFLTTFDDFVERVILWNGHIHPIIILFGIVAFSFGFKNIHTSGVKV